MLDLKILNTALFSSKEAELKTAIEKIKKSFDVEKATNILAYIKAYNKNINSNLLNIESDKLPKIVSDEKIINEFYNSEKNSAFFGFSNLARLVETKKST